MKQRTIKKAITIEGIGVHTGKKATLCLHPSPSNTGITIKNKLFPNEPLCIGTTLPEQAPYATVLRAQSWFVNTIEHLMAAIHGLSIDNIIIEIEGTEVPILDGSALPFVQAILNTGIEHQDPTKQYITPKETLTFKEGSRLLEIKPAEDHSLFFDYTIDFEHPLVQECTLTGKLTQDFFINEIAPARTFGFLHQLPHLRKHGLAQGTTLGNTVVVGEESYLNSLRFENEFIRHKLLDLIGDLACLGKTLTGTVTAQKTGHAFNRNVIKHFIEHPDQWLIY